MVNNGEVAYRWAYTVAMMSSIIIVLMVKITGASVMWEKNIINIFRNRAMPNVSISSK